jgi:hypothetical protein
VEALDVVMVAAHVQSHWFYNDVSGRIIYIGNDLLAKVQELQPTWHEFHTKAEAQAYKAAHPPSFGALGSAADVAGKAARGVDWGGFLSALSNGNTWLRVAEVGLGLVLIVVGLVKLAPPQIQSAAKVAALL